MVGQRSWTDLDELEKPGESPAQGARIETKTLNRGMGAHAKWAHLGSPGPFSSCFGRWGFFWGR